MSEQAIEKQRHRPDCTDKQTDLRLCCSHATRPDFLTPGPIMYT